MNKKIKVLILLLVLGSFTQLFAQNLHTAYFAGGCFWCMEPPFEKLDGVLSVRSGYAGGTIPNPTYRIVGSGSTKYIEAVEVIFDVDIIDYQTLLNVFWRQIDPTDAGGQFVDRGYQYSSAIFYADENQKNLAEASKLLLDKSKWFDKPIVTEVRAYTTFYPAEDYHQDYYKTNTKKYKYYRKGSGRDQFLKKVWGKKVDPTSPIEDFS